MGLREGVPGARPAGGEALDRLDRRVRRRAVCVRSPRLHVATHCNTFEQRAMRCSSVRRHLAVQVHRQAQRRADPSASALIDAVAELQWLDVSGLVQRHAPTDGSRALTRPSLTCVCMCVRVCVCARVCACACVCARVCHIAWLSPTPICTAQPCRRHDQECGCPPQWPREKWPRSPVPSHRRGMDSSLAGLGAARRWRRSFPMGRGNSS
jgi:hypothetical protein